MLPENIHPVYFTNIPSTGNKIKIRPFLAKEEKILLIAMQEKDDEDVIYEAIKQIVQNCTLGQVDVNRLATFDIDWLFLQLKIRSSGAEQDLSFICKAPVPTVDPLNPERKATRECGTVNSIVFNLETVTLNHEDVPDPKILLDGKKGIVMKYPAFIHLAKLEKVIKKNDIDALFKMLPEFVDYVFVGEKIYDEFTLEELAAWMEELTGPEFAKIKNFFLKIPKIKATIPLCCGSCGAKGSIVKEGLQSFLE